MTDGLYWEINEDNTFLHVGRAPELLRHLREETTSEVLATGDATVDGEPIEIYDSCGRRMRIAGSSFTPIDDSVPDDDGTQLLRDRIWSALACIQLRVDRSPEEELKGVRVPVVQADLEVVLAALGASEFFKMPSPVSSAVSRVIPSGPGDLPVAVDDNRGTPRHNATHHLGG